MNSQQIKYRKMKPGKNTNYTKGSRKNEGENKH
jgi:hypothetical protein